MSRHYLTLKGIALYTSSDIVATAAMRGGWRKIGVKEYSKIMRANNASSRTAGTVRQNSKSKSKKASVKSAGSPSRR